MTYLELKERSNAFIAAIDNHVESIVNYNERIEELNRKQLRESKLANGNPITPPYRRRYAMWKSHYFPGSYGDGKVNLFLTGRLYGSLELTARGDEYQVNTDVPYAAGLYDKYSNYLGIAPENQPEAQRIVGELLVEKYTQSVLR